MPKDELITALYDALLTDAELAAGEDTWRDYPDPFPVFQQVAQ